MHRVEAEEASLSINAADGRLGSETDQEGVIGIKVERIGHRW